MKMLKTILPVLFVMSLLACKKDEDEEAAPKTRMELLTSKTWIYDEYFTNYNSTGTVLSYKRGKANNSLNLSANRSKLNADYTTLETNQNGQTVPGTWKFLNNETQTQTTNNVGVFTSTIVLLDENNYIWYDATASGGTYAKMIPLP